MPEKGKLVYISRGRYHGDSDNLVEYKEGLGPEHGAKYMPVKQWDSSPVELTQAIDPEKSSTEDPAVEYSSDLSYIAAENINSDINKLFIGRINMEKKYLQNSLKSEHLSKLRAGIHFHLWIKDDNRLDCSSANIGDNKNQEIISVCRKMFEVGNLFVPLLKKLRYNRIRKATVTTLDIDI